MVQRLLWIPAVLGLCASGSEVTAVGTTAPPLAKVLFSEDVAKATNAQCLDQSPAGYYLRPQDPSRWVIYLQGGGLCVEPVDCIVRAGTNLGSSKKWSADNPDENPFDLVPENFFQNFSQVFVPYCSGDMWLGTDRRRRILAGDLQMSGHLILQTVLEHLANNTAFGSAREVIFAGTSAGGVGVIQHSDWFTGKMASFAAKAGTAEPTRIVVVPLAGIFFPAGWPVLFEEFIVGGRVPLENFMAKWCHMIEGGFMHEGCVQEAKSSGKALGTCFDVSHVFPHINATLFVAESQFDSLQIHDLGLCPGSVCTDASNASSMGGKFIRFFGSRMRPWLQSMAQNRSHFGLWAHSLFNHDGELVRAFAGGGRVVGGLTFAEAFREWYVEGKTVQVLQDLCDEDGPCPLTEDTFARAAEFVV